MAMRIWATPRLVCTLQNFIAIAIFIGDGLYNFLKIGFLSLQVSIYSAETQMHITDYAGGQAWQGRTADDQSCNYACCTLTLSTCCRHVTHEWGEENLIEGKF